MSQPYASARDVARDVRSSLAPRKKERPDATMDRRSCDVLDRPGCESAGGWTSKECCFVVWLERARCCGVPRRTADVVAQLAERRTRSQYVLRLVPHGVAVRARAARAARRTGRIRPACT